MRPKTTDKAGKGAAAGPTSVGEPSEPTPDSPFCLTLVLDVCLVAAETLGQPTAIAIDAAGPQPDSLPDDIQEAPLLVNPFFRYTFVNGDRITTPTVGLAGSSWTAVVTPSAGSNVESIPTTDGSWAAAEVGEVVENETLPECVVWRYRRTHQLQGADDGEVRRTHERYGTLESREATIYQFAHVHSGINVQSKIRAWAQLAVIIQPHRTIDVCTGLQ